MQFSGLLAFFITLFAFGLLVSAAPVEERDIDKRDIVSEVLSAVQTLQTEVLSVVDSISLLSPITATANDILPLVDQIESLVAGATLNLDLLGLLKREELDARQLGDLTTEIADVLGGIISSVTGVLGGFTGVSGLSGVTSILDDPLSTILTVVEGLIPGVLTIVAGLLGTVVGLLGSLGLSSLLGILAL
ncbi:hypothetical protein CALVIDRAFT_602496 [Calocera viscosa TUFC12733]|uniref:Sc15 protein n=1 Tax=Calocera viscosa (strain TUFC12733) TaxID=1330018 RepID=A0A167GZR2_CALVF|nr:hypothetical protein CALVIDRAFT_602496 [Calocera viscosa TUFC12733]